jgi:large subunit ribosomal protein L13
MKTYSAKPSEIVQEWFVIDATGLVLGRLASHVAMVVRGKHKPMFTPHMDCGDKVIIINAEKVAITGKKLVQKIFHWHTGFPGGVKQRNWKQTLESKYPERLLEKAIERMLPKESPLARQQFARNLYVYAGDAHPHAAQSPKVLDVASLNRHIARTAQQAA